LTPPIAYFYEFGHEQRAEKLVIGGLRVAHPHGPPYGGRLFHPPGQPVQPRARKAAAALAQLDCAQQVIELNRVVGELQQPVISGAALLAEAPRHSAKLLCGAIRKRGQLDGGIQVLLSVDAVEVLLQNNGIGVLKLLSLYDGLPAFRIGKGGIGLAVAAIEEQRLFPFCYFRIVSATARFHAPE
jgi:hypothetical protein